jgi:hypothetical protein
MIPHGLVHRSDTQWRTQFWPLATRPQSKILIFAPALFGIVASYNCSRRSAKGVRKLPNSRIGVVEANEKLLHPRNIASLDVFSKSPS